MSLLISALYPVTNKNKVHNDKILDLIKLLIDNDADVNQAYEEELSNSSVDYLTPLMDAVKKLNTYNIITKVSR